MRNGHDVVEGGLRGALGSLAGLAAMGLFFRAVKALDGPGEDAATRDGGEGDDGPIERHGQLDDISIVGHKSRSDEPATATLGRLGYEAAKGEEPDEELKAKLGQAVHWSYGVMVGSMYGALRADAEEPDLLGGLGYGTALWVLGDEIAVPMLGLSEGPTAHSWKDHAKGLGAHLVYGAATSAATQALRRVM